MQMSNCVESNRREVRKKWGSNIISFEYDHLHIQGWKISEHYDSWWMKLNKIDSFSAWISIWLWLRYVQLYTFDAFGINIVFWIKWLMTLSLAEYAFGKRNVWNGKCFRLLIKEMEGNAINMVQNRAVITIGPFAELNLETASDVSAPSHRNHYWYEYISQIGIFSSWRSQSKYKFTLMLIKLFK